MYHSGTCCLIQQAAAACSANTACNRRGDVHRATRCSDALALRNSGRPTDAAGVAFRLLCQHLLEGALVLRVVWWQCLLPSHTFRPLCFVEVQLVTWRCSQWQREFRCHFAATDDRCWLFRSMGHLMLSHQKKLWWYLCV